MVKADMRKGMLLKGKIGAEERIYRVLDLKEKVLVLDCVKKTMPVWKTYEELSDCVEKEEESMAEAIDIIDKQEVDKRIEYALKAVGLYKYKKKHTTTVKRIQNNSIEKSPSFM